MSEPKVDEKKMVRRNVAIALGIICIVLLVSLFGVILTFEYQSQAASDAASRLDRSLVWINNQTIHQAAGSSYSFYFSGIGKAGYYSVDVQSSTNNTYVWYEWSYLSPSYDDVNYGIRQINNENLTYVGTGGTVNFAILPNSVGAIVVGNNNTDIGATITLTITYYY